MVWIALYVKYISQVYKHGATHEPQSFLHHVGEAPLQHTFQYLKKFYETIIRQVKQNVIKLHTSIKHENKYETNISVIWWIRLTK